MKIAYSVEAYGAYELYRVDDPSQSLLVQTDWDYPGLASTFGWCPCPCGLTDGTVKPHRTASEMIAEAVEFLDNNEGLEVDDPGYFDGVAQSDEEEAR